MRRFLIFFNEARSDPFWKDPMKAGRMDIVSNVIIHSFFVSNAMRGNVKLHLILNGPRDPPKHIEITSNPETPFSKKDVAELIRIALWKYEKRKRKTEALPGVFVEKKSFEEVLDGEESPKYLLDIKGKPLWEVEIGENPLFILGDHLGLPKDKYRYARKNVDEIISLGPVTYFTSQCIMILHFWLDMKGREIEIWEK